MDIPSHLVFVVRRPGLCPPALLVLQLHQLVEPRLHRSPPPLLLLLRGLQEAQLLQHQADVLAVVAPEAVVGALQAGRQAAPGGIGGDSGSSSSKWGWSSRHVESAVQRSYAVPPPRT